MKKVLPHATNIEQSLLLSLLTLKTRTFFVPTGTVFLLTLPPPTLKLLHNFGEPTRTLKALEHTQRIEGG